MDKRAAHPTLSNRVAKALRDGAIMFVLALAIETIGVFTQGWSYYVSDLVVLLTVTLQAIAASFFLRFGPSGSTTWSARITKALGFGAGELAILQIHNSALQMMPDSGAPRFDLPFMLFLSALCFLVALFVRPQANGLVREDRQAG
jgi:hypothetical protein